MTENKQHVVDNDVNNAYITTTQSDQVMGRLQSDRGQIDPRALTSLTSDFMEQLEKANRTIGERSIVMLAASTSPSMSVWLKEIQEFMGTNTPGRDHRLHRITVTGDLMGLPEPEIEMNAVGGGKSVNPILLDRYKKGKQNRGGKKRRTSW